MRSASVIPVPQLRYENQVKGRGVSSELFHGDYPLCWKGKVCAYQRQLSFLSGLSLGAHLGCTKHQLARPDTPCDGLSWEKALWCVREWAHLWQVRSAGITRFSPGAHWELPWTRSHSWSAEAHKHNNSSYFYGQARQSMRNIKKVQEQKGHWQCLASHITWINSILSIIGASCQITREKPILRYGLRDVRRQFEQWRILTITKSR